MCSSISKIEAPKFEIMELDHELAVLRFNALCTLKKNVSIKDSLNVAAGSRQTEDSLLAAQGKQVSTPLSSNLIPIVPKDDIFDIPSSSKSCETNTSARNVNKAGANQLGKKSANFMKRNASFKRDSADFLEEDFNYNEALDSDDDEHKKKIRGNSEEKEILDGGEEQYKEENDEFFDARDDLFNFDSENDLFSGGGSPGDDLDMLEDSNEDMDSILSKFEEEINNPELLLQNEKMARMFNAKHSKDIPSSSSAISESKGSVTTALLNSPRPSSSNKEKASIDSLQELLDSISTSPEDSDQPDPGDENFGTGTMMRKFVGEIPKKTVIQSRHDIQVAVEPDSSRNTKDATKPLDDHEIRLSRKRVPITFSPPKKVPTSSVKPTLVPALNAGYSSLSIPNVGSSSLSNPNVGSSSLSNPNVVSSVLSNPITGPTTLTKSIARPSTRTMLTAGPSTLTKLTAGPSTFIKPTAGPSTLTKPIVGPPTSSKANLVTSTLSQPGAARSMIFKPAVGSSTLSNVTAGFSNASQVTSTVFKTDASPTSISKLSPVSSTVSTRNAGPSLVSMLAAAGPFSPLKSSSLLEANKNKDLKRAIVFPDSGIPAKRVTPTVTKVEVPKSNDNFPKRPPPIVFDDSNAAKKVVVTKSFAAPSNESDLKGVTCKVDMNGKRVITFNDSDTKKSGGLVVTQQRTSHTPITFAKPAVPKTSMDKLEARRLRFEQNTVVRPLGRKVRLIRNPDADSASDLVANAGTVSQRWLNATSRRVGHIAPRANEFPIPANRMNLSFGQFNMLASPDPDRVKRLTHVPVMTATSTTPDKFRVSVDDDDDDVDGDDDDMDFAL